MYRGLHVSASGAASAAARSPIGQQISMDVEFAQLSDLGRIREGNEDYLGFVQPDTPEQTRSHGWLFAVADGVGGHDLGEVASHTAVECLLEGFRSAPAGTSHAALLERLIKDANTRVIDA